MWCRVLGFIGFQGGCSEIRVLEVRHSKVVMKWIYRSKVSEIVFWPQHLVGTGFWATFCYTSTRNPKE